MARVEFNVRTNREGTPPTYVLLVLESSRSGEDCIVTLTGDAGQKFLYRGTDQLEQQRVYKATKDAYLARAKAEGWTV